MTKLQRIDGANMNGKTSDPTISPSPTPQPSESDVTFPDGYETVTLSDGTIARFREPRRKDIRDAMAAAKGLDSGIADLAMIDSLICRCCVGFGEQGDLPMGQLESLSFRDSMRLQAVFERYMGEFQKKSQDS